MYNGHKNWNHWNVSLWIANDEGLYRKARVCRTIGRTLEQATAMFLEYMGPGAKTPDGAPYSRSSVRAALRDL